MHIHIDTHYIHILYSCEEGRLRVLCLLETYDGCFTCMYPIWPYNGGPRTPTTARTFACTGTWSKFSLLRSMTTASAASKAARRDSRGRKRRAMVLQVRRLLETRGRLKNRNIGIWHCTTSGRSWSRARARSTGLPCLTLINSIINWWCMNIWMSKYVVFIKSTIIKLSNIVRVFTIQSTSVSCVEPSSYDRKLLQSPLQWLLHWQRVMPELLQTHNLGNRQRHCPQWRRNQQSLDQYHQIHQYQLPAGWLQKQRGKRDRMRKGSITMDQCQQ